jgi:DNA-binding CsgD family transcriptional regulator
MNRMAVEKLAIESVARNRGTVPGLIMLDGKGEPIHVNSTAHEILCYGSDPQTGLDRRSVVFRQVRSALRLHNGSGGELLVTSGRRQYVCWIVPLEPFSRRVHSATLAIVLTRSSGASEYLRRSCEQYKLTPREREVVCLLSQGFKSKEIACRMNISAHTVKVFLHSIMLRLGVTTRSGIVGKITSQIPEEQIGQGR